jgi:sec-independent protein translocase protein TatC
MKQKNHNKGTSRNSSTSKVTTLPFIEHAYELRRRIYYIVASTVIWGSAAYVVQEHIVSVLLKPSRGEKFIYTTPGGGIDFLFKICLYTGLIFSLPVIVYNLLRFIEPLIARASKRFIAYGAIASGVLAIAGMVFGYYIGLPSALHFLDHQFTTVQIKPLVTVQSYLQFVIVYMVGSAMLFQLPLILLFINRIKPLSPRRLFHYERWVILIAFVLSGLMNPTPNLISQLFIAGPFIAMYQLGIGLIAFINRHPNINSLYKQDIAAQASRSAKVAGLKPVPVDAFYQAAPIETIPLAAKTKVMPSIKAIAIQSNIPPRSLGARPARRADLGRYMQQRQTSAPTTQMSVTQANFPSIDIQSNR